MKILSSAHYALSVCAAAVIFAGCNGGGSSSSEIGYSGQNAASSGAHVPDKRPVPFLGTQSITPHPDHHKSWLSPELKADRSGRLLFVSDPGTYDVYIFRIPGLKLLGTLTGFSQPQGECSDNLGHVWVDNTGYYSGNHVIYEYAHDGTLINTLNDPTGLPVACAWDAKTGNLAVANIFDDGGSEPAGEILVYPEASGTPTSYTDPDMYYYYYMGYDNESNLFIDGTTAYPSYSFVLGELPKSGSAAFTINLTGGTIYDPGGVQWYTPGNDLIVGDQVCGGNYPETSCLYAVSTSGSAGTITGSTHLNNAMGTPVCDVGQTVRTGGGIYGGDLEYPYPSGGYCASGGASSVPSAVYHWRYPAGNDPIRGTTNTQSEPDGMAISNAIGGDANDK